MEEREARAWYYRYLRGRDRPLCLSVLNAGQRAGTEGHP